MLPQIRLVIPVFYRSTSKLHFYLLQVFGPKISPIYSFHSLSRHSYHLITTTLWALKAVKLKFRFLNSTQLLKGKRIDRIAASAIIHEKMFYPFDILCIQCTFFYTSFWSLRLMLVSDIVVLILDRDLSGFYVYFAPCLLHFLLGLQQFFSLWRKMRKHQRKNVSNFCITLLAHI